MTQRNFTFEEKQTQDQFGVNWSSNMAALLRLTQRNLTGMERTKYSAELGNTNYFAQKFQLNKEKPLVPTPTMSRDQAKTPRETTEPPQVHCSSFLFL